MNVMCYAVTIKEILSLRRLVKIFVITGLCVFIKMLYKEYFLNLYYWRVKTIIGYNLAEILHIVFI